MADNVLYEMTLAGGWLENKDPSAHIRIDKIDSVHVQEIEGHQVVKASVSGEEWQVAAYRVGEDPDQARNQTYWFVRHLKEAIDARR